MLVPAIKQNPLTSIIAQSLLSMLQNKFSASRASEEADKQRAWQEQQATKAAEKAAAEAIAKRSWEGHQKAAERNLRFDIAENKLGFARDKSQAAGRSAAIKSKDPFSFVGQGGQTEDYVDAVQNNAFDQAAETEDKLMQEFGAEEQKQENRQELLGQRGRQAVRLKGTPTAQKAPKVKSGVDEMADVDDAIAKAGLSALGYKGSAKDWSGVSKGVDRTNAVKIYGLIVRAKDPVFVRRSMQALKGVGVGEGATPSMSQLVQAMELVQKAYRIDAEKAANPQ